jgi:hypothetical protein
MGNNSYSFSVPVIVVKAAIRLVTPFFSFDLIGTAFLKVSLPPLYRELQIIVKIRYFCAFKSRKHHAARTE